MEDKIVIHSEYNKLGEGIEKTIKEMEKCSNEELRLWIIQELSSTDSECWWLVDIGIKILKEKNDVLGKKGEEDGK